jgi:2-polyprenyl-3-methyl-5-hydroxy-6-metoxy-1,4-benzoquinol methylase|tara:strand:- start:773 stop:1672 length:900 start_codon:yes stop_codon:yes gene_type:complete
MIQVEQCPVCAGEKLAVVFAARDHVVTQEEFKVLECDGCGLRLTSPVPDKDETDRYYESENYTPHAASGGGNFAYRTVRKLMLARKRNLVTTETKMHRGRILDVGCGSGEFLHAMHRAGWEVDGIDASEVARREVSERYAVTLRSPEEWFAGSEEEYDVITFWHAFEHIPNPNDYLRQVTSSLRDDGTLVLGLPNWNSLDAEHYGAEWAAYDVPRHITHFTRYTMETLLERHGLSISSTHGLPFDAFYISMLSEKSGFGSTLRGLWTGLKSNLSAVNDSNRWSSIIYIIRNSRTSERID